MWFPRLDKSMHRLFQTQFLFCTKIKYTYKNVLGNTKSFDLSVKNGLCVWFNFWSKAKMSWFAPNIFLTLYQFSGSISLTIKCSKKIVMVFFHFGKMWPILTLDMVKKSKFFIKQKNDYLIKTNHSCFIMKVKIFIFLPCLKSK